MCSNYRANEHKTVQSRIMTYRHIRQLPGYEIGSRTAVTFIVLYHIFVLLQILNCESCTFLGKSTLRIAAVSFIIIQFTYLIGYSRYCIIFFGLFNAICPYIVNILWSINVGLIDLYTNIRSNCTLLYVIDAPFTKINKTKV